MTVKTCLQQKKRISKHRSKIFQKRGLDFTLLFESSIKASRRYGKDKQRRQFDKEGAYFAFNLKKNLIKRFGHKYHL